MPKTLLAGSWSRNKRPVIPEESIKAAATWWTAQLLDVDFVGFSPDDPGLGEHVSGAEMRATKKRAVTRDAALTFYTQLCTTVAKSIESGTLFNLDSLDTDIVGNRNVFVLAVSYDPCPMIADALEAAGINPILKVLPFKARTVMAADFAAAQTHHGPATILWSTSGPHDVLCRARIAEDQHCALPVLHGGKHAL